MVAAPTGAGKTRIIAEVVIGALTKGKRVLITVPMLDLVDQTVTALEAEGVNEIGVIQGLHERTDSSAPVQVASVDTLRRRAMPACDVILIDEAHRWFKFFAQLMADAKAANVPVIGFSATPWTVGLGRHFDELLQVTTTQALITAGYLSPFRVYAPTHPDLAGVHTVAGDFKTDELAEVMNKIELVADIVSTWHRLGEQRPTLCFAVDRAHAAQLQQQFEASGVPTAYVDCNVPRQERRDIRERFRRGEIKIITNVATMTTGIDLDVRCLILARPTKSEILFTQIVGRGLRTADGKDNCLILDHSDTTLRLGFVTDIAIEELDEGRERKRQHRKRSTPRECKNCGYLRPKKVSACPACGFTPEPQVGVEVEDGDLVEFKRRDARHSRHRMVDVYGQLLTIARERAYAKGWAAHKFKDFFGQWPNGVEARPQEPQPDVLNWVRSRQVAFAKRSGRAA